MNPQTIPGRRAGRRRLWLILAAALALRLALAAATQGYPYDMSCFVAWGDKLLTQGPAAFYSEGYFADYPPGYLPVLALAAKARRAGCCWRWCPPWATAASPGWCTRWPAAGLATGAPPSA